MKNRGVMIPLLVGAGVSGLCSFVVWDKYGDRAALFVACCFLLVNAAYWIAEVARYCEIEGLCVYLMRIRSGDYALDIRDNREGSISKLKNDIYKLTVMLREQAELLRKDKAYLADSLADISHQIKTPLTSMAVMTDLLREPSLPEEKRLEFLNSIRTTIDRMEWLVSTLLKLGQAGRGLGCDESGALRRASSLQGGGESAFDPRRAWPGYLFRFRAATRCFPATGAGQRRLC